jgi:hypothetical protein
MKPLNQNRMTPKNKQMLRDYFKAIKIDQIKFNTRGFAYTRLTYVKSLVGYVNELERTGVLDKMRILFPFLDTQNNKIYTKVLDEKETRFNFGQGWLTSIDLTESDKKELKDFAEKASNSLTRKI